VATAGYARDWINSSREVTTGAATESHGGNEATMAAQWSRPLTISGFNGNDATLTPKGGLQYLHLWEGGFGESGAGGFDLSSAGNGTASLQPYLGIAASQRFIASAGTALTPEVRLGYARELMSNARVMTVASAGGTNFLVSGAAPSHDMVTAGFGIAVTTGSHTLLYADYDATLPTGNTFDQTFGAGIRMSF
jgi:outer membrane autotransporter protein